MLFVFNCTDEKPDLITLERFPHLSGNINIMQEVVPRYKQLGNILLKNPDGLRVMTMEKNNSHNVESVLYDIFQAWLLEDVDATWSKLVRCLKKVNLNSLAQNIESCLV